MRRINSLLVILALFAALQTPAINVTASLVQESSTEAPALIGARLVGKKLFVVGENFTEGAQILVNGEPIKTKNDPDSPGTMLIAKKGKKQMPRESAVVLSVRNATGTTSEPLEFFTGLTITLNDSDQIVSLKVGEKFEVALARANYEWTITRFDSELITPVLDRPTAGAQGIFLAVKAGDTPFSAVGDLPCRKSLLPCFTPPIFFEAKLVIFQ